MVLLKNAGINFEKFSKQGIQPRSFAE